MPFSSSKSNSQQPPNIPLRTLPDASSSRSHHETHDTEEATSFLRAGAGAGAGAGASYQGYRVDKPGSDDSDGDDDDGQDTDSWVETGDIGDQVDAEDPLRARLNETLDESALAGLKPRHAHHHHNTLASGSGSGQHSKREKKHVRIHDEATYHDYDHHGSYTHTGVLDKEAIEIPELISLKPSTAQRIFAAIMPGSSRGFTGKPLMYVSAARVLCSALLRCVLSSVCRCLMLML